MITTTKSLLRLCALPLALLLTLAACGNRKEASDAAADSEIPFETFAASACATDLCTYYDYILPMGAGTCGDEKNDFLLLLAGPDDDSDSVFG